MIAPALLLAGQAAPAIDSRSTYQCLVNGDTGGGVFLEQTLDASGTPIASLASWVQDFGSLHLRGKAARDATDRDSVTFRVDSRHAPLPGDPAAFDIEGASIELTVNTVHRLHGPAAFSLQRPSRTGDLYEPPLTLLAGSSHYVP